MEIEQLRQLEMIARSGSVSAAARVCHVSQSALSRSMQRLESECGTKLFSREKGALELNEVGSLVLEHARVILREERAMHDSIDRFLERERMLVIGTVAPSPVWMITSLVVKNYPGTVFQIDYLRNPEAAPQLLGRSIDMALTTEPLDLPGCTSAHILDEHLSLLLPSSHSLAGSTCVTFEQLDGETFLVDSMGGFWVDLIRDALPHARIIEQADRSVLLPLIASSGLLSFATNATESWGIPDGFETIPFDDDAAHVSFYLTTSPNAPKRVMEIAQAAVHTASSGNASFSAPVPRI